MQKNFKDLFDHYLQNKILKAKLYNFEPITIGQKLTAMVQNTFEMQYMVLVSILAMSLPSLVSAAFFLLGNLVLVPATVNSTQKRLSWGKYMLYFNGLALLLIVAIKIHIMHQWNGANNQVSEAGYRSANIYF